jgi:hypothetical protein
MLTPPLLMLPPLQSLLAAKEQQVLMQQQCRSTTHCRAQPLLTLHLQQGLQQPQQQVLQQRSQGALLCRQTLPLLPQR